jgi:haloalkane dehalogenase
VSIVDDYSKWLAQSDVPKLFVNAEPGAIHHWIAAGVLRTWTNLGGGHGPRSAFRSGGLATRDRGAVATFVRRTEEA